MERLYTMQEVSKITGIRLMDVIDLVRNNDIDAIRAIRESDLIDFQKRMGLEPLTPSEGQERRSPASKQTSGTPSIDG